MIDHPSPPPTGGLRRACHVGDALLIGDSWIVVESISAGIAKLRIVAPPELRISRVDAPRVEPVVLPVRRVAR